MLKKLRLGAPNVSFSQRVDRIRTEVQRARAFKQPLAQFADIARHWLRIGTHPLDYYRWRFYDGKRNWDEKSRYVSQIYSRYWIWAVNPIKYNVLFTDKYVQKLVFSSLGIPTAKLLATAGKGRDIRSPDDFSAFLQTAPEEFVIKRISGAHGSGFIKVRQDSRLYCNGQSSSVSEIWQLLSQNLERGYLIEQALSNTPEMQALNESSLNTFRICTFQMADGTWRVIDEYLKIGRAGSPVDNGSAGGLAIPVRPDGTTGRAALYADDFGELVEYAAHPDSGAPIEGKKLDCLPGVQKFAVEASAKFPFMGTLGWDIAMTPDGPVAIEANAYYICDIQQSINGPLVDEATAQELPARSKFASWDRRFLYPRYWRDG